MSDLAVIYQKYSDGLLIEGGDATLSGALTMAAEWLETIALANGHARFDLIIDLNACRSRVDQTHQPVPADLTGSTLTYNCADCDYIGTITVAADPAVLTWVNP